MNSDTSNTIIGVDLGGTKILAGKVIGDQITQKCKTAVPNSSNEDEILNQLYSTIDPLINNSVVGLGIGVPGVVNISEGIVYDVQNIPSWKEVYLKEKLENRYKISSYVNNDANCFAAGEKYFGSGKNQKDFVALIVGTGIAAGLIINNHLYNGHNCGAGEFGMIPYLDQYFEYYCSGQFFKKVHNRDGEELYHKAIENNAEALAIFNEFGAHLGNALKAILYSIDPPLIIMGGSVSKAYPYFKDAMWNSMRSFAYKNTIERLDIKISSKADMAVLGAAALFYDSNT